MQNTVFLDTETTGLFGDVRIVDVAVVDHAANVLVDTLVNPGIPIPAETSRIHGIYDADVAGKPTIDVVMPLINDAIRGREVIIYNASYDQNLFSCRLGAARSVICALRRFKSLPIAVGKGNGTLTKAAEWAGHTWTGVQHRALADALAARTVWLRLEGARAERS